MPGTAGAAPNRFQGSIAPSPVQPPATGTYTIAITNQPNSNDNATEAHIGIPSSFVVDGLISPPVASIVSGPCAGPSWTVASLGVSSIDLVAPDASAALCDRGTLGVTFNVLVGPSGDGTFPWMTQLSAGPGVNFAAESQPTLVVDGTPPPPPSIDSKPANPTNQTNVSFGFSDTEGGVSFQCQLDGTGFSTCSSPWPYSGLTPNASHTFDVKAVDPAGNESGVTSYAWTIDTAPPPAPAITSAPPDPS